MAYFFERLQNHITPAFIARITHRYGLEPEKPSIHYFGGWQNAYVQFTSQKKTYYLRFYKDTITSRKKISQEIKLLAYLSSNGLPVAPAMEGKNRKQIYRIMVDEKPIYCALFAGLHGFSHDRLNIAQIQNTGLMLAQLHTYLRNYPYKNTAPTYYVYPDAKRNLAKLIHILAKNDWQYASIVRQDKVLGLLKQDSQAILRLLRKYRKVLQPLHLIHNDYQQSNLKFKRDQVSGIFDFNDIVYSAPIVDIAKAIAKLVIAQDKVEQTDALPEEVLPHFIKGYEENTPLTAIEKRLLPVLIRYYLWKELTWTLAKTVPPDQLGYHQLVFGACWYGITQIASV